MGKTNKSDEVVKPSAVRTTSAEKKPRVSAATAPAADPTSKKTPSTAASTSPARSQSKAKVASTTTRLSATSEQFLAVEQDSRELPLDYGDTKIVLMTRDPEWIFAYWEISADSRKKFGIIRGKNSKPLTVRFHELKDGASADYSDVTVNELTSSWYFKIPNGSSSYRAELGIAENEKFTPICSSNVVSIPRHGIADETPLEFAEINDEVYDQIVQLSGGFHISERLGSDEFMRSLQQKVFQSLTSGAMFSGALGGSSSFSGSGFSGDLFSGAGIGGEDSLKRPSRPGEFWLEVGVDVIVYGATTPDAKVTLMGKEISLSPGGTFRVRMVLPDTSIEFPVEAVSADGGQRRRVQPVVSRATAGDPHRPV